MTQAGRGTADRLGQVAEPGRIRSRIKGMQRLAVLKGTRRLPVLKTMPRHATRSRCH
jgi:hypothetical protein